MMTMEQTQNEIRKRREKECFPIINRGESWKRRLTSEQRNELEHWYQMWLDAPETLTIPVTPDWVNQKTKPEEILL